jgi:hypothetical protein
MLLPYLTRTGSHLGFYSMTRYLLLAFPVFIVAADWLKARAWLAMCVIGLSAAMLFAYMTWYAQWYSGSDDFDSTQ